MCKKCVNYKTCPIGTVPDSEECKRSLDIMICPKTATCTISFCGHFGKHKKTEHCESNKAITKPFITTCPDCVIFVDE